MDNCGIMMLNFEEMAKGLAERNVCTEEEALLYFDAEDAYYDEAMLNVYDPAEMVGKNLFSNKVVDQRDVDKYIVEHTNLSLELVEKITMYMFENVWNKISA